MRMKTVGEAAPVVVTVVFALLLGSGLARGAAVPVALGALGATALYATAAGHWRPLELPEPEGSGAQDRPDARIEAAAHAAHRLS